MDKPLALVIEDDDILADLFARAVGRAGFQTEIIHSGSQAIARLQQVVPHLVTLDLKLPGVSGIDVLTSIRADDRFSKTRVIITTGEAHQAGGGLEDLADLILIKPVGFIQLRDLALRIKKTID